MTRYKWYSVRGNIVRLAKYVANSTKGNNVAVFLFSCLIYALFDIYGVAQAPRIVSWVVRSFNQQKREVMQWRHRKIKK